MQIGDVCEVLLIPFLNKGTTRKDKGDPPVFTVEQAFLCVRVISSPERREAARDHHEHQHLVPESTQLAKLALDY